jgi:O-antigen/teichoic acid export membrane protein
MPLIPGEERTSVADGFQIGSGSMLRTLLRHSAIYSLVGLGSRFLSFLLVPVYTRCLSPADYGLLELLDLTSNFIAALIASRIGDAMACEYHDQPEETRNRVISTTFVFMLAMSAIVLLSAYLFTSQVSTLVFGTSQQSIYFHLTFTTLALMLPTDIGLVYVRVLNKSGLFTVFQLGRILMAASLALILLLGFHLGVLSFLYASLISGAVSSIAVGVYVIRRCGIAFDLETFKRQVRFVRPLLLNSVGMITIHYGDRFFLQRAASLSDVGIYSLSYKIGMLVSYLALPFSMYWHTQMYDIVKRGGHASFARMGTYVTFVFVTVGLVLSVSARPVIGILAAPAFRSAALYVPAIALAYVAINISEFFRSIFLVVRRTAIEGRVMLFATICCVAAYATLIPRYKIWGACASTLIVSFILLIYGVQQAIRVCQARFEFLRLAKISAAALLAYVAYSQMPIAGVLVDIMEGAASLALFVVLIVASRFFRPDEQRAMRTQWRSFVGRVSRFRAVTPKNREVLVKP